jgi:conjugal transfer ATP-binding protein TraC
MLQKLLEPWRQLFQPANRNLKETFPDNERPRTDRRQAFDTLGSLLPYTSYEDDFKLFVIEGQEFGVIEGLGFVMEVNPQIGASEEMGNSLVEILKRLSEAEPGLGIQVTAFGSPDMENLFHNMRRLVRVHGATVLEDQTVNADELERRRQRLEALDALNERRIEMYRKATTTDLHAGFGYRMRDIRSFISVVVPCESADLQAVKKVAEIRDSLKSTLENYALFAYDWTAEELIYFLGMVLNPHRTAVGQFPVAGYDDGKEIRSQVVMHDTRALENEDEIQFRSRDIEQILEMRALSPVKYPKDLQLPNIISLLGDVTGNSKGYPCMYLITAGIAFKDYNRERSVLSTKAMRAQQTADSQMARYLPKAQEVNYDYKMVQQVYESGGRNCDLYHQLLIFAASEDMPRAEQAARRIWMSQRYELAVDARQQKLALLSSLPMLFGPLLQKDMALAKRLSTKTIYNAANSLPLLGEFRGSMARENERGERRAVLTTFGRLGQPSTWDLFANANGNYNAAVVGTSGSGKSAFCNELVMRLLSEGDRGWIIDVGGSYKKLCEQLGGQYIAFGKESKINLNPFYMFQSVLEGYAFDPAPYNDEQLKDEAEDLSMLLPVFEQMVSPSRQLTDYEQRQLMMHVQSVMLDARLDVNGARIATIDDLAQSLINNCEMGGPNPQGRDEDWIAQVRQMTPEQRRQVCDPRIRELGQNLQSFGSAGVYGSWFQGASNVNLRSDQLAVLELEELNNQPDLRAVVLMLLMRLITNEMYLTPRSKKKFVLIDEAWDLMGDGSSGKFIEVGYRRARKYGGAFITATQSVEDYFKSETAKAAFMNSDWVFLLRQKKESIDALANSGKFAMDDYTKSLIKGLKTESGRFSEIFVRCGDLPPAIGRLFFDPYTLLLASSRAEDVEAIDRFKAQGYSVAQAVEQVLKERKVYA